MGRVGILSSEESGPAGANPMGGSIGIRSSFVETTGGESLISASVCRVGVVGSACWCCGGAGIAGIVGSPSSSRSVAKVGGDAGNAPFGGGARTGGVEFALVDELVVSVFASSYDSDWDWIPTSPKMLEESVDDIVPTELRLLTYESVRYWQLR